MSAFRTHTIERLLGSVEAIDGLRRDLDPILDLCQKIRTTIEAGGTLFTCGNGGSAAEALHLAEEMTGKYRCTRAPLAAACLNADPTALTCIANDFGFEEVFARLLHAQARKGDALLVFSTSGQSPNVVRAMQVARDMGLTTLGLLGRDGGRCLRYADVAVIPPSQDTAHIQEAHQVVLHLILEALEFDAHQQRQG